MSAAQPTDNLPGEVTVWPDKTALAEAAAERISAVCRERLASSNQFLMAVSGGSTPLALFQILAGTPYRNVLDDTRVLICWVDERCVPHDDPDSNYGAARQVWLREYTKANVIPIPADPEPQTAADAYERHLRTAVSSGPDSFPVIDVLLLGLGDDGHTASLFPGTEALTENRRWATANYVPQKEAHRITLTYPVLNRARNIVWLVAGENKGPALRRLADGQEPVKQLPAGGIHALNGSMRWMLDRAATEHMA